MQHLACRITFITTRLRHSFSKQSNLGDVYDNRNHLKSIFIQKALYSPCLTLWYFVLTTPPAPLLSYDLPAGYLENVFRNCKYEFKVYTSWKVNISHFWKMWHHTLSRLFPLSHTLSLFWSTVFHQDRIRIEFI